MDLVAHFDECFPPKPTFHVDDIPDLTGKIAIVTGGNAGVGKETVKALLTHNAKVYLAARNPGKAAQAIRELCEQTGKEAIFLHLDLASLKCTKAAAEEFKRGILKTRDLTEDGYDMQFGVNVLGHAYFTKLLLPTLLSTAKATPSSDVRVVTVSSNVRKFGKLDFNAMRDTPTRRKSSPTFTLYPQSKLGNIVYSMELARRYGDQGIVSIAVNPGNLQTDIFKVWLYPVPLGALTQLCASTSPEGANFNGKYLWPWARIGKAAPQALEPETGKQLWEWLEEQIEIFETRTSGETA